MSYRSASRGFMYTAPPSDDDRNDSTTDAPAESDAATEATDETPNLEPTTAATDANWTGTVPADD
ncbi:hypothetical protein BRC82_02265 [Halobacteriales archaeon QS_1_67_19]|nr:MAG: hypothetical protein BRC82_02265 [Halobacteriales archaeon QS_1_67_19]